MTGYEAITDHQLVVAALGLAGAVAALLALAFFGRKDR